MHESFLVYRKARYLWLAMSLTLLASLVYMLHDPRGPANGGTWLGYTLGTISALMILWLMYFGIRKRQYQSDQGTVRGWLSAHVYFGLSLVVLASLHAGFQVGWNVHTLAYVLMLIVIFSGLFGVVIYIRYPLIMSQNRSNDTQEGMLSEIELIDKQSINQAKLIDTNLHSLIQSAAERTVLGGHFWNQLLGRDGSNVLVALHQQDSSSRSVQPNPNQSFLIEYIINAIAQSETPKSTEAYQSLLELIQRKKLLLKKVRNDIRMQALLEIWLYFHVPLSFALLAALITHVISVFFYW